MNRIATPAEVPGFLAARHAETVGRDIACLCQRSRIFGFDVQPITLRIYGELRLARSPLFRKTEWKDVMVVDLIQFLWRLNPQFTRNESLAKTRFQKHCIKLFAQPGRRLWQTERQWQKRLAQSLVRRAIATKEALSYVSDSMSDSPAASNSGSGEPEPYSDLVAIVCRMGHHFNWAYEATLDTPLKVIFQALRIARVNDWVTGRLAGSQSPYPVFLSRSDGVIERYLREINGTN